MKCFKDREEALGSILTLEIVVANSPAESLIVTQIRRRLDQADAKFHQL